jgi:hypothetical protein
MSGATAIFTCLSLLQNATKAADAVGIPRKNIYILPMPGDEEVQQATAHETVDELVNKGKTLPEVVCPTWVTGQGSRQPAYLCFSSGTSGMPVSDCFFKPTDAS